MEKAIAVYLDDSDKLEIEFSWLYKTWILYSLNEEYDLVVYYNPEAKNRLSNFPGIVAIPMAPIRMANEYKFLNSHYFCMKEWNEPLKKYSYLLKTDCDVFLTEHMKGYVPSKILVGQGGYYNSFEQKKVETIKFLSQMWGLDYKFYSNIGASFFGRTDYILPTIANQALVTEDILNFYNSSKIKNLNGLDIGIASMIAGEITINHSFSNQHIVLYSLDSKCWTTTNIGSDTLHIHAWHSNLDWSKHKFFKGEYTDWKVEVKDAFLNAANYCHWIATLTVDDLYYYRDLYANGKLDINYGLLKNIKNKNFCIFTNDNNTKVLLPDHKYSEVFSKRDQHEVFFRRIINYLIQNKYIRGNIIDLGAWIGDNAIPWSKNIDGTVYAIDPSPGNCNFIELLLKDNFIKNVKIIQKAISSENKVISTSAVYGDDLYHCTLQDGESGEYKFNSYSLDYLYKTGEIENIDFIHLDVEGMEYQVVIGAENLIQDYYPIITFEQHLSTDDYSGLSKHLGSKGYYVYMINEILPGCNPDCRNFLAIKSIKDRLTPEIAAELVEALGKEDLLIPM